jgi:hypothetical protein
VAVVIRIAGIVLTIGFVGPICEFRRPGGNSRQAGWADSRKYPWFGLTLRAGHDAARRDKFKQNATTRGCPHGKSRRERCKTDLVWLAPDLRECADIVSHPAIRRVVILSARRNLAGGDRQRHLPRHQSVRGDADHWAHHGIYISRSGNIAAEGDQLETVFGIVRQSA